MSVKGNISSANSNPNRILLFPYRLRRTVAAIGAYRMSVTSPRKGITSEELPRMSIAKQIKSLPKSGAGLMNDGISLAFMNFDGGFFSLILLSLEEKDWATKPPSWDI